MFRMMNIDIEAFIDLVTSLNDSYMRYKIAAKNLHQGPYRELSKRKAHLEYCSHSYIQNQYAVNIITTILKFDEIQNQRLGIAARAVYRWRIRTNYEKLIPDVMQRQIENFIFGKPSAPNTVCRRCGVWMD